MGASIPAIWCLLVAAPLFAQMEWTRLQTVQPGTRVSALTQDGKYLEGRLRAWTPDAVEIAARNDTSWIRPGGVKRVWIQQKTPRWHAVLIGAAIGFTAAFPIGAASAGYIADQNNPSLQTRAGFGAGFGLFGAGIGAGIGALTGGSKNVLVYRGGRQ